MELAKYVAGLGSDIKFVVIGDGVERDEVVSLAQKMELSIGVFLYIPMAKKQLVYAFRDAAMVISTVIDVPELEVNSANKIFDAMAAGKALAINHGGWQKIL